MIRLLFSTYFCVKNLFWWCALVSGPLVTFAAKVLMKCSIILVVLSFLFVSKRVDEDFHDNYSLSLNLPSTYSGINFVARKNVYCYTFETLLAYFFITFCFLTLRLNKIVLLVTHAILNYVIFTTTNKCVMQKFKFALKLLWPNYTCFYAYFKKLWTSWGAKTYN